MDKELLDLLNNARQSGANEEQLQGIVDSYNLKKKSSSAVSTSSSNGQSQSQSPAPDFNFINRKGESTLHVGDDPLGNTITNLQSKKDHLINSGSDATHIATSPIVNIGGKGFVKTPKEDEINAVDADIQDIKQNAFSNPEVAQQHLKQKLAGKTAIKKNDVFQQPQEITPDSNLNDFDEQSIKQNLNKGNVTDQLAFDRLKKQNDVGNSLSNSSSINEAALKYESAQNPQIKKQIDFLNNNGQKLPDAFEGTLVSNFINNPDVLEAAKQNPDLANQIGVAKSSLFTQYPDFGKRVVATKISQAREDAGLNNSIVNIPTQESTDKLVQDMYAKGDLSDAEKDVYDKSIRPSLGIMKSIGRGIGRLLPGVQAAVDESPIVTPGFFENTENSYVNTLHGMAKTIEDVPKIGMVTESQKLSNALQNDYSNVSINPKGAWHELGQAGGNMTGFVLPMIMGGAATKAIGMGATASELIPIGLATEGNNKDNALKMFPDDPTKQYLYTTLATAGDMMIGKLLPTKEAREGASNLLKGDIKNVITDLTDGKITEAAARNTILEKAGEYVGKVAKGNLHTGAAMAGFGLLHNGLDAAFGGRDVSLGDAASEAIQNFKTGFLGGTLISAMAASGGDAKLNGKVVREMAENPDHYAQVIEDNAKLNPDLQNSKDEKLQNLQDATLINNDLEKTDLTDKQKEKYLIQALNQKVWERKAASTSDETIRKTYLDKAKESQKIKEKIYSNEDKATDHANYTEPIQEPQTKVPVTTKTESVADEGTNKVVEPTETPKEEPLQSTVVGDNEKTSLEKSLKVGDNFNFGETKNAKVENIKKRGDVVFIYTDKGMFTVQEGTNSERIALEQNGLLKPITNKESTVVDNKNISSQLKPTENGKGQEASDGGQKIEPNPTGVGDKTAPVVSEKTPEPPKENIPIEEGDKEENTIAINHEGLNKLAKKLGLPEIERGTRLSNEEYANRGRELLNGGADIKQVEDDFKNGKQPTADEISIARAHFENLENQRNRIGDDKLLGRNSDEYKDVEKEINRFSKEVIKPMGTKASEPFAALQGERNLDTGSFTSVRKAYEEESGKPMNASAEREMKDLTNKVNILSKEKADLLDKLSEALSDKEGKKTYSEKAKTIADKFRKLKTNPFVFKDENGNDVPIQQSGIGWNDLVELGATAIEKTGQIIDGIKAVVDKIKDEDWYKNLSSNDKDKFETQLQDHYEKSISETPEVKELEKLRNRKEKLEFGNIDKKEKPELKFTEAQKNEYDQLKKEISDLEKHLGLKQKPKPISSTLPKNEEADKFYELATRFADKKDYKFTPEDAKDIWDYARSEYLNKGIDFDRTIKNTADDLGLTVKQVQKAITTTKSAKVITDAIYAKQYRERQLRSIVEQKIKSAGTTKGWKILKAIPNFFFKVKIFGHGTVAMITHAGLNAFNPELWKTYFTNFGKQYKLMGSKKYYEKTMQELRTRDNYIPARRAGLANDPGEKYDDYEKGKNIFGKIGEAGQRGFDILHVQRQDMFDYYYGKLSDVKKADPEIAKEIATTVNHATGTTSKPLFPEKSNLGKFASTAVFALKLEASRWARIATDPAKVVKSLSNWSDASDAEKVRAKMYLKRTGYIISTYLSALAANKALLSLSGSKQKINFFNPLEKDWMKFKGGGEEFDLSGGMVGALDFLGSLLQESFKKDKEIKKGGTKLDEMKDLGTKYVLGKLSPFASTVKDLATQHDYSGNTLPFSNSKPYHKYNHQMTWKEYAFENQLPIPLSEGAKVIYDEMEDQGMDKVQAMTALHAILTAVISGGTGVRVTKEFEGEPTPYTEEDNKKSAFKYFIDKGLSLPNTSPTSEPIKDFKTHTEKMLSDYPKDIVEKYTEEHKNILEKQLKLIEKRGYVYVNSFGHVSINYPESTTEGARKKSLENLDDKQLTEVLHLSQSKATTETKEKLFYKGKK